MRYCFEELQKTDGSIREGKGNIQGVAIVQPDMLHGKGRLFNHFTIKPGCSIGKHPHNDEFEVFYILSGNGTYDDNGTIIEFNTGDVLICNSGEEHTIENTGTEDVNMIALILYN